MTTQYALPPPCLGLLRADAPSQANTVTFEISAASVEANLEASLSLQVEVYGINAINVSINLCDELGGVLCPLSVLRGVILGLARCSTG